MAYKLFALDGKSLRTAEVADMLSNNLSPDQAFEVLRVFTLRTACKSLASAFKLNKSTSFKPEALIHSARELGRIAVFFGLHVKERCFVADFSEDPKEAFLNAEDDLRCAVVVAPMTWGRAMKQTGRTLAYEPTAVSAFVRELVQKTVLSWLNECMYEVRRTDLLDHRSESLSGFTSVNDALSAVRRTWPQWKELRFSRLTSADTEHPELTYWRNRRHLPCDAGLTIRADILEDFLSGLSNDEVQRVTYLLGLAQRKPDPRYRTTWVFCWKDEDWNAEGGESFEALLRSRVKSYGYCFLRIRSELGDVVSSHGTVTDPSFRVRMNAELNVMTMTVRPKEEDQQNTERINSKKCQTLQNR